MNEETAMTKAEMIESLLSAFIGNSAVFEARQRRLQRMTAAGLKREMLLRGILEYDELEDERYEDDVSDEPIPATFLGIVRDPLYAD